MAHTKGTWFHRLLRKMGLDARGRSAELTARLARAEERVTLTRRVRARARSRMLRWKEKSAVRKARERQWSQEIERAKQEGAARIKELELEVARLTSALRTSEHEKLIRVEELEALAATTEQLAQSGREQLNTIEVKLDLVDAALNTLDRRYRTIVTRGPGAGV
jgi:chromosome segregation ATPase